MLGVCIAGYVILTVGELILRLKSPVPDFRLLAFNAIPAIMTVVCALLVPKKWVLEGTVIQACVVVFWIVLTSVLLALLVPKIGIGLFDGYTTKNIAHLTALSGISSVVIVTYIRKVMPKSDATPQSESHEE